MQPKNEKPEFGTFGTSSRASEPNPLSHVLPGVDPLIGNSFEAGKVSVQGIKENVGHNPEAVLRFGSFGLPVGGELFPTAKLSLTEQNKANLADLQKRLTLGQGFNINFQFIEEGSNSSNHSSQKEFKNASQSQAQESFANNREKQEKYGSLPNKEHVDENLFYSQLQEKKSQNDELWTEYRVTNGLENHQFRSASPLSYRRANQHDFNASHFHLHTVSAVTKKVSGTALEDDDDGITPLSIADCRSSHDLKMNEALMSSKLRDRFPNIAPHPDVNMLIKFGRRVDQLSQWTPEVNLQAVKRLSEKVQFVGKLTRIQAKKISNLEADISAQKLVEESLRGMIAALRNQSETTNSLTSTAVRNTPTKDSVISSERANSYREGKGVNELILELEAARRENTRFSKLVQKYEDQIAKHESEVSKVVSQLERMASQNQTTLEESKQLASFKDIEIRHLNFRIEELNALLKAKDDKIRTLEGQSQKQGSSNEYPAAVTLFEEKRSNRETINTQSQKLILGNDLLRARRGIGLDNSKREVPRPKPDSLKAIQQPNSANKSNQAAKLSSTLRDRPDFTAEELRMANQRLRTRIEEQIEQISKLNKLNSDLTLSAESALIAKSELENAVIRFKKRLFSVMESHSSEFKSKLKLAEPTIDYDLASDIGRAFSKVEHASAVSLNVSQEISRSAHKRRKALTTFDICRQAKYDGSWVNTKAVRTRSIMVLRPIIFRPSAKPLIEFQFQSAESNEGQIKRLNKYQLNAATAFRRQSGRIQIGDVPEPTSPIIAIRPSNAFSDNLSDANDQEVNSIPEIPEGTESPDHHEEELYQAKYAEQVELYTQLSNKYFPLQEAFNNQSEKLAKYKKKVIQLKSRYEKSVEELKKLRQFKYDTENAQKLASTNPFLRKSVLQNSPPGNTAFDPEDVDNLKFEISKLKQEYAHLSDEFRVYKTRAETNRLILVKELAALSGVKEQFQVTFAKFRVS